MLVLESLVYHVHSYGEEFGSNIVGNLVNATNSNTANAKRTNTIDFVKDQGIISFINNQMHFHENFIWDDKHARNSFFNFLRPSIATSSSIYGSIDEHGPHLAIDGKLSGGNKGNKIGLLDFQNVT